MDTAEIAKTTLLKLSGIRAGQLPITLAGRLADVQVAHARSGRGGNHPLCDECGRSWPCTSYKLASLDDIQAPVGDEPAARVAMWEKAIADEEADQGTGDE